MLNVKYVLWCKLYTLNLCMAIASDTLQTTVQCVCTSYPEHRILLPPFNYWF